MGFPLRSNIFAPGTNEHRHFSKFPLQIAVLFSPEDQDFSSAFRDRLVDLHRLTGEDIAFFAVLDQPTSWLRIAAGRSGQSQYRAGLGPSDFTYDDKALLHELARLFGVEWRQFPALVISPNLWNGEHIVVPSNPDLFEPQIQALTTLVKERGRPTVSQIIQTMQETFSVTAAYNQGSGEFPLRLHHFYRVLDTYTMTVTFGTERDAVDWTQMEEDYKRAAGLLQRRFSHHGGEDLLDDNDAAQAIIADVSGFLIPSAVVAAKSGLAPASSNRKVPFHLLEQESQAEMVTAQLILSFFEILDHSGVLRPDLPIDYAPAAQGLWKAYEREINYSLIQAARAARTVPMPEYFTLYYPDLLPEKAKVQTSKSRTADINQRDNKLQGVGAHVFLPLGTAMHVIKSLLDNPQEELGALIQRTLGGPLPPGFFDDWGQITDIRNEGSHVHLLDHADALTATRLVLDSGHLPVLHAIKQALRS
jgi:hypothetical protein